MLKKLLTKNKFKMRENIFKVFSNIKLDIEGSNLGQVGWLPSESDLDYMPIEEYNLSVEEFNSQNSKVLFTNIRLDWDSCDCGEGYGCSHGSWVYQLTIINDKDKTEIDYVDGDALEFYNNGKSSRIPTENATVYDFIRNCEMCDINLEFSDYAKSLLEIEIKLNSPELIK